MTAGLLPIDKPEGPTSHDVIDSTRRILGIRRIGHTGTLDPFASGLLILCVGWATRLAEYVSTLPKTYRCLIRLGERTDTDDRTGTVVASSDGWQSLRSEEIEAALRAQEGEIEQRPPAYSARRVEGRRAYEIARAGERPRLGARRVSIARIAIIDISPPDVDAEIDCSGGTYIRAVARDLGETLGVGAHLRSLRRLGVGEYRVEDAIPLLPPPSRPTLEASMLPPAAAVSHLRRIDLDAEGRAAVQHGRPIPASETADGPIALFHAGRLVAVAEVDDGWLRPRKVFPVR